MAPASISGIAGDAGNQPNDHYKTKLSPLRYKLRSMLLPIIRQETDVLSRLQQKLRYPILDFYFAWTANLAAHTFYVLMLPLPIWFGAGSVVRDLVSVLGLGIYILGNCKDYMCLPRPRSPPVHRITMSSYTAQEYGWPSSHSANATAVTLILFHKLWQYQDLFDSNQITYLVAGLLVYYVSLIFGRLYCGMHGFCDVLFGSIIGTCLFCFRVFKGAEWDQWLLTSDRNDSWTGCLVTLAVIIGGYLFLIHTHTEPIDDCPCFDDSVAFVGVLMGLDLSHWLMHLTGYYIDGQTGDIIIPYDGSELGVIKSAARVIIGILLVVSWKTLSKPVIFTILPPFYKTFGIYLPRKHYESTAFSGKTTRQIRSQSLSNMHHESISGELQHIIKDVMDHDKRDEVGPETQIDVYEMMDYENSVRKRKEHAPNTEGGPMSGSGNISGQEEIIPSVELSGVFKPRYDVETVGRLIIYAGIPVCATWGFAIIINLVGLN